MKAVIDARPRKTSPGRPVQVIAGLFALNIALVAGAHGDWVYALGRDQWMAPDKLFHAAISVAMAALIYAAAGLVSRKRSTRFAAAVGLTLAAGLGKEALDLVWRGTPSLKDLAWDVFGVVAAVPLLPFVGRLTDAMPQRPSARLRLRAPAVVSAAVVKPARSFPARTRTRTCTACRPSTRAPQVRRAASRVNGHGLPAELSAQRFPSVR